MTALLARTDARLASRTFLGRVVLGVAPVLALHATLLSRFGKEWIPGDSKVLYLPAARNLLRHGSYSVMDSPPYVPTITKMPGYSLFLAVMQGLFGDRLGPVQVVQFIMIGVTALLAAVLGRRLFDERTGLVAGVMVAIYPAFSVHAMVALSESLACLLAMVHISCLVALVERKRTVRTASAGRGDRLDLRMAALTGLSLGALVLVRQSLVFLLPVAIAATVVGSRHLDWRRAAQRSAIVCLVVGVLVGPWIVRNLVVSHQLLPFGANSGLSLVVSARQYSPQEEPHYLDTIAEELATIDAEDGAPTGTSPGMGEGIGGGPVREARLERRLTEMGLDEFAQLRPVDVAKAIPGRMQKLWSGASLMVLYDQIENVLTVLGLGGALVLGYRRRELWPLWMLVVYLSLFHLVFHVEQRYSMPARPALLILAAAALVQSTRFARTRLRSTPAL